MRSFRILQVLACLTLVCYFAAARADDWPQWLGPQRDGVWREKGLIEKFPPSGAKELWRRKDIGEGYAGPAVAQGKVFVTDRIRPKGVGSPDKVFDKKKLAGVERLLCLDEKTGKTLWQKEYECLYEVSYAYGPRTTPVVSGDKVYTLGTMGDLYCFLVKDGTVVWSKKLPEVYDFPTPLWGFSGHPLVDGNRLICLVGGKGSVVVAFDKDTGKELWKNLSASEPGYAPPVIFTIDGKRQLVLWHAESVNGLDLETGKLLWSQPFGSEPVGGGNKKVKAGMTIPTPRLLPRNRIYLSCFYNGSLMFELKDNKPTVLWKRTKTVVDPQPSETEQLHCVMSTPVYRDGYIYGVDSYGEFRCLDATTGERIWTTFQPVAGQSLRWANAFIVQLGDNSDRYVLFNELGDLIICRLTPEKYEEISRAHILDAVNIGASSSGMRTGKVIWSHPAFADRCVFARTDGEIVCVSMAAD
jgi:outer membrane protein assembly factor BamB